MLGVGVRAGRTNARFRGRRNAPGGGLSLPAWLTSPSSLGVNEWREISGSSLSLAPTMPEPNGTGGVAAKQNAWCGWAIDTRTNRIYSVGQGGHGDYHGNEVNVIDMTANAPAWSELVAPSSSANVTASSNYYSDGKPTSVHGYYTTVVVPEIGSNGKILRFPGAARSTDGAGAPDITAFDIASGTYDGSGTWGGSGPGGTWDTGSSVFARHPTTGDVYYWRSNTNIGKWAPGVPGTFSNVVTFPSNPAVFYTAAAIDPTRGTSGTMFLLGGGSTDFCRRVDLNSGTIDTITLTGTDIKSYDGIGLVYCQTNDRYYACIPTTTGGSTVYEITPGSGTSWACSLLSTTGGGSIPASDNGVTLAMNPFTKFLYTPSINGSSVGGVFFGPQWSANVWFLRLH